MKNKRIVFIQGAFDIINWGHVKAFERAKKLGDYLIVGLNSDKLVKDYKNRASVLPYYQKKKIIESLRFVDKVVPCNDFSPLKELKKYKVDVYVLTKEWESTKEKEISYMKKKGGKVSFSPRFKGVISTSQIKQILHQEYLDGILYHKK